MRKISVIPELVDGCQMFCVLCWNSNCYRSMENMSISIVKEIVKKYNHELLCWYNWGEPLLHKQFVEVSELIRSTNSYVSSNFSLSLSDEYFQALTKWKRIFISISGMTQDVYKIYNRGGDLKLVLSNIEKFLKIKNPRYVYPVMVLRWLSHPLNTHQKEMAIQYCVENRMLFAPITLNCCVEDLIDGFDHPLLKNPKFNPLQKGCPILNEIPIGVDGSYLLCCASRNVKTGYSIFDDISVEELLKVRMDLELCRICRERKLFQMYR